ncbi:MAG: M23 family metallopeptidase [Anaerotignaceae bacterium]
MIKTYRIIKINKKVILFYAAVTITLATAFVTTNKNITVYSKPAVAAFYTQNQMINLSARPKEEINNYLKSLNTKMESVSQAASFEVIEAQATEITQAKNDLFIPTLLPVNGTITSGFLDTEDRTTAHKGIDFGVSEGTNILACASGTVTSARWSDSYGYVIEINHGNGYTSLYAHNSQLLATVGDTVNKGDIIALSGNTGQSTGPHLHMEILLNGTHIDPLTVIK